MSEAWRHDALLPSGRHSLYTYAVLHSRKPLYSIFTLHLSCHPDSINYPIITKGVLIMCKFEYHLCLFVLLKKIIPNTKMTLHRSQCLKGEGLYLIELISVLLVWAEKGTTTQHSQTQLFGMNQWEAILTVPPCNFFLSELRFRAIEDTY